MRRTASCPCLLALIATAGIIQAGEQFDPAARAKAIGPFIDEATIAVIHGDMSRADPAPFVPVGVEMIPGFDRFNPKEKAEAIDEINSVLAALARAGCHDVYVVVSLRAPDYPCLIVPLPQGARDDALKAVLSDTRWLGADVVHDAFVSAPSAMLERMKRGSPDPRPELAEAFEAAGDTAAQLLILPPKHTARVLDAVLPTLPDELGGGPSNVFTRGVVWAALGLNVSPETSANLVVQSEDDQAAVALRQKWIQLLGLLEQNESIRAALPDLQKLIPLLTPQAQGDRLTLTLDRRNRGSDFVEKLLDSIL